MIAQMFQEQLIWESCRTTANQEFARQSIDQVVAVYPFRQASAIPDEPRYEPYPISPLRSSVACHGVKGDIKQETQASFHTEMFVQSTTTTSTKLKLRSRGKERKTVAEDSAPKILKSRYKVPKGRLEKAERNALTNIGNQLLTFLCTKMRCNYDIERLFPTITPDEKQAYFTAAKGLRQHLYGYISERKLIEMWHPDEEPDHFHWVIIRALSHYFLREKLVCSVATSKRLPSEYKPYHFSVRRKLLRRLSQRTAQ